MIDDSEKKLRELHVRLENLAKYEAAFKREIADLRREIAILHQKGVKPESVRSSAEIPRPQPFPRKPAPSVLGIEGAPQNTEYKSQPKPEYSPIGDVQPLKANLEKFVGTYLISVLGIMVTIIGVGIGAKYAIDNELISPLFRILFGYAIGFLMTGTAVYLKAKYESFSAVLLSGGMAILYFITFFAYSFYSIISQTSAFALMVIFTAFTVVAAILYSRQIIAHIGLVGSYAVPFLLSDGSGRASILFTYIAIINIGILAVSVNKYWRLLFYSSFVLTWLIFAGWYFATWQSTGNHRLAFVSASVFYAIFYATFLIYKLVHKKPLSLENAALVVTNSFVFFAFGYAILSDAGFERFLGLFTLANAAVHYAAAQIIRIYKLGDRSAFYLAVVLVLVFVTIAVPVQAEGIRITLLWTAEALFLFAIGRIKRIEIFEYLSFPLMVSALLALVYNWITADAFRLAETALESYPLLSGSFATSLFAATAFGVICLVDRKKEYECRLAEPIGQALKFIFPAIFLAVLYNTFRIEIDVYFYGRKMDALVRSAAVFGGVDAGLTQDRALSNLNLVWQINYSLFFVLTLTVLNLRRFRNSVLGFANLVLTGFSIAAFVGVGLFTLGFLREIYSDTETATQFYRGIFLVLIRYVPIALTGLLLYVGYKQVREPYIEDAVTSKIGTYLFEIAIVTTIWVLLSNELITWAKILNFNEPDKLGLSILWGVYAICLIVLGIARRLKHIRIFAIGLFGLTLAKLFLYDMANLETIPKTVLFVSIGFMLLIASFLYNKFTKRIFDDESL